MKLEEWCRWEKERAITVDFFFNKFKIVLQEKGRYKEQKLKKKKNRQPQQNYIKAVLLLLPVFLIEIHVNYSVKKNYVKTLQWHKDTIPWKKYISLMKS